jgi:hypothetical protein
MLDAQRIDSMLAQEIGEFHPVLGARGLRNPQRARTPRTARRRRQLHGNGLFETGCSRPSA